LYKAAQSADSVKPKVESGVVCFLEDLSENGCGIRIRGEVPSGLHIFVVFALNGTQITIAGRIKSVENDRENNYSLLHVEAELLPISMKNTILAVMFGILPEGPDLDEREGAHTEVPPTAADNAAP
jgi:hypothetical protein